MTHELEQANLLSTVTDALLLDPQQGLGDLLQKYVEIESFVWLIYTLNRSVKGQNPSRRFVKSLKHDLLGTPKPSMAYQVRHLPPRVQIAAGVALVIGFLLLKRRKQNEVGNPVHAETAQPLTT